MVRDAVIGLGANLGSRAAMLRAAIELLRASDGIKVVAIAPVRCTEPVGPPQPAYFNSAVRVQTTLEPEALLAACLAVEARLGRVRRERWGARTIDLDVLWIDGVVLDSSTLRVPHPELLHRAFALTPLVDVAPDAVDPRDGRALAEKLALLAPGEEPTPVALDAIATLTSTAENEWSVLAADRADALAMAAQSLATTDRTNESVAIDVHLSIDFDDTQRAQHWLDGVAHAIERAGFGASRVVVLEASNERIGGLVFGARGADRRARVHVRHAARVDDSSYRISLVRPH